jgi:hypothetical protein
MERLGYLKAALKVVPEFQPDGKPAAFVSEQAEAANAAFRSLVSQFNAAHVAEGGLAAAFEQCHQDCTAVYACLKSVYRADAQCRRSILELPKEDRSPGKTLERLKATAALWATLPNVPGTDAPMTMGNITRESLAATVASLDAKLNAAKLARAEYLGVLAQFHERFRGWDQFVSAALVQGRARFKAGTPERAVLDRVPRRRARHKPGAAEITTARSPGPGAAHLEFAAARATRFAVWHREPGESEFSEVAEVLLPGVYDATGLPPGAHEYRVTGRNARGEGEPSATVSVAVAAAAAA